MSTTPWQQLEEEVQSLSMGKLKSSTKSIQSKAVEDLNSNFNYLSHTPSSSYSSSSLSLHKPQQMEDSPSSSSFSSSFSSLTSAIPKQKEQTCLLPTGHRINPKRFFFSPRNTKSIMEEVKGGVVGKAAVAAIGNFREESEAIAMASDDPYRDFRSSMEEMVNAHELRDWPRLQQLLHCYLQLNDRKTHKIIVLAFVDLLMHLMTHDKELFSLTSLSFSS